LHNADRHEDGKDEPKGARKEEQQADHGEEAEGEN